jgi:hypothetical protein
MMCRAIRVQSCRIKYVDERDKNVTNSTIIGVHLRGRAGLHTPNDLYFELLIRWSQVRSLHGLPLQHMEVVLEVT